jgi:hypothetical protein
MPNKPAKIQQKLLFYFPRILSIIFILFISIFALDVFGEYKIPEVLWALVMHLIPTFILIALTILAWKKPKAGGIAFIVLSLISTIFFKTYQNIISLILISLPPFATGILFYISKLPKKP